MNAIVTTPDVKLFVQAVRERLADLSEEEREELIGGLDADMSDLVAERGVDALPEPSEYARELRAAAGFSPEMGAVRPQLGFAETVTATLDTLHDAWDRYAERYPGKPLQLLESLRPLWWVVRAWVAVEFLTYWLHYSNGRNLSLVPGLRGFGWLVMLAAVVGSIQVGRGALWPGTRGADGARPPHLRLVLLGLNLFALLWAIVPFQAVQDDLNDGRFMTGYDRGYQDAVSTANDTSKRAGIYVDGRWVSNIYPYDAQGRPLVGVQLVDQIGRPISVVTQPEYGCDRNGNQLVRVLFPWRNGAGGTLNAYPLTSRVQRNAEVNTASFGWARPPTVGRFPKARLGKVELPGVATSRQKAVPGSVEPGALGTPLDQNPC